MIRRPLALLLPLTLLLAGCTDRPLPTAAPEGPIFVQVPASPVVNNLLDDGEGCTDAKCTLRDAIAFASAGATITFSVMGEIALQPARGQLLINKNLTISGPGAASLAVSGSNASRVFYVVPGTTASISGLTVTRGNASTGGGILNEGTLTLTHSTISGNGVGSGGGGGIDNRGTLTLTHSTISGNTAAGGGGIINSGALTLASSAVWGNSAFSEGGGIYSSSTLTLTNSTVSGNDAAIFGGGIRNLGTLTLTNSTVAENGALGIGGGISNAGTLTLSRSIVANSTAGGDCSTAGAVTDGGHNLVEDGSCIAANGTSKSGDPLLGSLQDNGGPTWTHALLPGSVAIDAIAFGSDGCGISTDQRGFPRPQGSGCDIGAFEVQPPTLTLGIQGEGSIGKRTGVANLSGTLTCSAPVTVTLNVSLSQTQAKGKNTTTVSGSGSTSVACSGTTPWTAEVTPTSGKFVAGAADASASVAGASPPVQANQTVQLK